jgi:23S rRNA (cytosine1962-C5)-methyltransferase
MAKVVWRLRKGMDRRFRSGHPWVYSNELMESPKGIEPGAAVHLQDAGGGFLALGYGNPKSLISFRALTRDGEAAQLDTPFTSKFLLNKLLDAHSLRHRLGLTEWSYRLCYGEGDFVPGLIIDRYRTRGGQVFVVQAHTAGADQMLRVLPEALEAFVNDAAKRDPEPVAWAQTALIINNELGVRALEGIESQPPKIVRPLQGVSKDGLSQIEILVRPVLGGSKAVEFTVDLVKGQKTGFFLDQASNVGIAAQKFSESTRKSETSEKSGKAAQQTIRILDLCCYVGQWGTQLARAFKEQGFKVEVLAVDASQQALDFAKKNMEREGAKVTTLKGDVLKDLADLEARSFDLVVCDPPALIKGRKDIPQGRHAYLQLNTQVFRLVCLGGAVVSCSCSALLEEVDFYEALSKAARRNDVQVQWIARGSQSSDHPMLLEFPEGRYLKSLFGIAR